MNRNVSILSGLLVLCFLTGLLAADDFMGEYKGTFLPDTME